MLGITPKYAQGSRQAQTTWSNGPPACQTKVTLPSDSKRASQSCSSFNWSGEGGQLSHSILSLLPSCPCLFIHHSSTHIKSSHNNSKGHREFLARQGCGLSLGCSVLSEDVCVCKVQRLGFEGTGLLMCLLCGLERVNPQAVRSVTVSWNPSTRTKGSLGIRCAALTVRRPAVWWVGKYC